MVHPGGGTKEDAQRQVPEKEKDYPEPNMFGTTPAHGFFIRHARGVEMNGIKIEHAGEDLRPGFVVEDVDGADVWADQGADGDWGSGVCAAQCERFQCVGGVEAWRMRSSPA